jgi:hypothetical protein
LVAYVLRVVYTVTSTLQAHRWAEPRIQKHQQNCHFLSQAE